MAELLSDKTVCVFVAMCVTMCVTMRVCVCVCDNVFVCVACWAELLLLCYM
jgi:hypothetical protein